MALDLRPALNRENPIPIQTVASLSSTNWLSVLIPVSCVKITIGCELHKIYLSFSYADGSIFSATNSILIAKDSYFEMYLPDGTTQFQICAKDSTASTVMIVLEER